MDVTVTASGDRWQAVFGRHRWRCAVGRSGVIADKREGDGATPVGCWVVRGLFYRPDRLARPETALEVTEITPRYGWCDDPDDPNYNRLVGLPYAGRHETLWREDRLYDLLVTLGYNDDPPVAGLGSAIFLHVASADYRPTEGCVALALADLQTLIAALTRETRLCVRAP